MKDIKWAVTGELCTPIEEINICASSVWNEMELDPELVG